MLYYSNKDAFFEFMFDRMHYTTPATLARLLHKAIEIKTPYKVWVSRLITRFNLLEGLDYQKIDFDRRQSSTLKPQVYAQLVENPLDKRLMDVVIAQPVVAAIIYSEAPSKNTNNWISMLRYSIDEEQKNLTKDEKKDQRLEELRIHFEQYLYVYDEESWDSIEFYLNSKVYKREAVVTVFNELLGQNYWVRSEPLFNFIGDKGVYEDWVWEVNNEWMPVYGKDYTGNINDDFPELEYSPSFLRKHVDKFRKYKNPDISVLFAILERVGKNQEMLDVDAFISSMPIDELFRIIGGKKNMNIKWKYINNPDEEISWNQPC